MPLVLQVNLKIYNQAFNNMVVELLLLTLGITIQITKLKYFEYLVNICIHLSWKYLHISIHF